MKRNQNRKLFKKKSRSNYKLGCIITIVILIPVLYGVYLYCQQFNTQTQKSNEPQVNTSSQIPSGRNLEIPVSLAPKQEQIIRHTGYTVSYNKDLKLPNWVSYELTRQETKGKEKRSNRFIADPLAIGTIATNADYTRSGYDKGHMAPAQYYRELPFILTLAESHQLRQLKLPCWLERTYLLLHKRTRWKKHRVLTAYIILVQLL